MDTNALLPMRWAFPWIKIKRSSIVASESISEILAEVRAIYQELAKRPVQRNCLARTECCQFQLTGLTPQLTKGEALLAAKALRSTGRRDLPEADDGVCRDEPSRDARPLRRIGS